MSLTQNTIEASTGKWIIIHNQNNGLSWIGLIGEVRASTDPWSDHDLEMFVAWNDGEPSWHEVVMNDPHGVYQSRGTTIRPKLPPGVSWIRNLGLHNTRGCNDSFTVGVVGKCFSIVNSPTEGR